MASSFTQVQDVVCVLIVRVLSFTLPLALLLLTLVLPCSLPGSSREAGQSQELAVLTSGANLGPVFSVKCGRGP